MVVIRNISQLRSSPLIAGIVLRYSTSLPPFLFSLCPSHPTLSFSLSLSLILYLPPCVPTSWELDLRTSFSRFFSVPGASLEATQNFKTWLMRAFFFHGGTSCVVRPQMDHQDPYRTSHILRNASFTRSLDYAPPFPIVKMEHVGDNYLRLKYFCAHNSGLSHNS